MAVRQAGLGPVEIRPLRTLEEFQSTLPLQAAIWGFDDTDQVAPRLFGVFDRIGGSCLGAYLGGEIVGFSLAFAAFKPDGLRYWHSHMVGVSPSLHGQGVGYQIKLRQREEALATGLDLIEWTFDPLQARNAYFNIEKLGVDVRAYLPDFYGITSSDLHGSLPTDRLVAAWQLRSPRVVARLENQPHTSTESVARIEIPARITDVPHERAASLQARVRESFQAAFLSGFEVSRFQRTGTGGVYHLRAKR